MGLEDKTGSGAGSLHRRIPQPSSFTGPLAAAEMMRYPNTTRSLANVPRSTPPTLLALLLRALHSQHKSKHRVQEADQVVAVVIVCRTTPPPHSDGPFAVVQYEFVLSRVDRPLFSGVTTSERAIYSTVVSAPVSVRNTGV